MILGDDDVRAIRVALVVEELAPNVRIVIEMTNPRLGGRLTELVGDCTLPVAMEVAIALPVSWKPLVKSKPGRSPRPQPG